MDITPLIWPCARLLIHTNSPMMTAAYSRIGSSEPRKLDELFWNLRSPTLSLSALISSSVAGCGPETA
jgi:hypothetical protein